MLSGTFFVFYRGVVSREYVAWGYFAVYVIVYLSYIYSIFILYLSYIYSMLKLR